MNQFEESTPAGGSAPSSPPPSAAAAAAAASTTGIHHAGLVKKKNRFGLWQTRYFEIHGDQLTYYKDANAAKNSQPPLHPAMKVEYCQLEDRFGAFSLVTDQKEFYLVAPSLEEAQKWVVCVENAEAEADRAELAQQIQAERKQKQKPVLTPMEGFLQIRSASRVKGWKDGFFRLEPCMLVYYKDNLRESKDYESQIVFNSSSTLESRPDKPLQFKLRTSVNSYTFKAPSADIAMDWLRALQVRIDMDQDDDEERLTVLIEAPPKWMVDWDQISAEDQVIFIQDKLDALFGRGGAEKNLQHTLNAVTLLIEELEDRARECLPLGGDPNAKTESGRSESRPDIFQVILRFYHIRIVDELSQFVSLDQEYEQFSLRELLSCMDLISAYHAKLEDIFQGEVGQALQEKIPPFGMMDNAENMAAVYLEKCRTQVSTWVDNVTETSSRKVEVRADGKYQTTSPALLLNLLNEALVLARRSGMKRLQVEVLALCAVSLGDFMHATVSTLDKNTTSFSYCVACANDCWSVMDYIGNFLKEQGNDEYDVNFMALEEKCAAEADKCLSVLAGMVLDDLKQTLAQCFTSKHLDSTTVYEDYMAIVCATCDDYLESFCTALETAFVVRLARMMMSSIVASYLARFGTAYREEGLRALSRKHVELIRLDRNRLTLCLQQRLPKFSATLIEPEFGALDDVLDMLTSPLAYIPQTVVKIIEHDESLRDHVKEIGRMMIDLSPLATPEDAKEIKLLLEAEVARHVKPVGGAGVAVETDFTNPFVRMWPLKAKKLPTPAVRELSRADSKALLMRETAPLQRLESAASAKLKRDMSVKQQSMQWAPPTKQSTDAVSTAILQDVLQFSSSINTPHASSLCLIRKTADGNEYEFVVHKTKLASSPIVFETRMSQISRIEFCDVQAAGNAIVPMVVGEDGKAKKDAIAFARTANTSSEFSVIKKQGNAGHFSIESGSSSTSAMRWVKELQLRMQEAFTKVRSLNAAPASVPLQRGASAPNVQQSNVSASSSAATAVVAEEESYSDMSTKRLKELARERKLDISACVERGDIIRVLEENDRGAAPLLKRHSTEPELVQQEPSPPLVSMLKKPQQQQQQSNGSAPAAKPDMPRKASSVVKFAPDPVVPVEEPVAKPQPVVVAAAAAAPVAPPPSAVSLSNMLDSSEEKIVEIQMLIFQGYALVEDGNPKEAVPVFKRAKEAAEQIGNVQLKAKASTGLASAYRDMPQMRRAAAPLFEVAATLFASTGDTSDRINVLNEAADIYVSQQEYAQAIRCLSRFDKAMVQAGSAPVFAARIQEIQQMSKS